MTELSLIIALLVFLVVGFREGILDDERLRARRRRLQRTDQIDTVNLELMARREKWAEDRQAWLEVCDFDPRLIQYYQILDELSELINFGGAQPGQIEQLWLRLYQMEENHD